IQLQLIMMILKVEPQYQYPALPTGCEVTAISMLLQYCCSNFINNNNNNNKNNKETILSLASSSDDDDLIPVGGNPYRSFVGQPTSTQSFGMFHTPSYKLITDLLQHHAIDSYFTCINLTTQCNSTQSSSLLNNGYPLQLNESKDYINARLNHFKDCDDNDNINNDDDVKLLIDHIDKHKIPIVIWMTLELREPSITDTWRDVNVLDNFIHWVTPEHCALLVGYTDNEYIINDPHTGKVEHYNKHLFIKRWRQMGRQAVTIIPTT
ncbi:hypothetical protein SAMD00019534_002240, partial [Acytostelium subglobosum LB1]|uniref:hypothetical protein n=1 Tax=Acytostelium subglobosum LB1 TaxID=1410327 RepID=UPI0006451654